MKTVAFIFARGGSKGLPGKNTKLLNGKPLIAHSIDFALNSPDIDDVIVSTDSDKIATAAKDYGASVPFLRPPELATDTSPEMDSWKHAIEFYQSHIGAFDRFISLPVVSPLREQKDLSKIWPLLKKADFVISAKKSDANPYFNLVERGEVGFELCKPLKNIYRRQDSKDVFQIIPMYYACKPDTVKKCRSLWDGKIEIIEIPTKRAADVDTEDDFQYLEFLFKKRQPIT